MMKILGCIMILLFFGGGFVIIVSAFGWSDALFVFGGTILSTIWLASAAVLITKGV